MKRKEILEFIDGKRDYSTFGNGGPVIGFLAEYDALSGLSQKANVPHKESVIENGNGHGCGHNLLGVSCLISALAVKEYLKQNNLSGTIRFFGCPGEEAGAGKT